MSTLHTVNKSPFQDNSLRSCLQVCGPEDSVLLIEDGVYGAIPASPVANELNALLDSGVRIYVLSNDAQARGMNQFLHGVETADYHYFVELSSAHRCMQSWY